MTDLTYQIYTKAGKMQELPMGDAVMALGFFDGVHIAHRQLLLQTVALKDRLKASYAGAWCFDESPAGVLANEPIPKLCTLEEKISMMLSLGLDFVAVGDFRSFSKISAEDFIEGFLKQNMHCTGAVCGFNHRFGHRGAGSPAMLETAFGKDRTVILPEVKHMSLTVSSSSVRELITKGDVEQASLLLGRSFSLTAPVADGKKLGRKLGFPTANQYFPEGTVIPAHGIYAAVCTTEDGKKYLGVSNVGIRPTITDGTDSHRPNCETYIHNFSGDLYGKALKVEFCKFLRREMKFESVEALKEQIGKDLEAAVDFFKSNSL